MKANTMTLCGLIGLLTCFAAIGADNTPEWASEGPYVEEPSFFLELPVETLATMMFVEIELGGAPRRFLFDTGSPSMMSADLASELQLEVIDSTHGKDAHGATVDTRIVQADLALGGTTFHKVPIFVAGFPKTAQCLFDGVLGSEVLPLCAWQIDLPDSVLRCSSSLQALDHLKTAKKQTLHDFGYPHAPILDIRFTEKARSKALFDTGSPEYLAISPADLEGSERSGGVGKTMSGTGSIGGSLGGRAPNRKQRLVELKTLDIGNVRMDRVGAVLRHSAPSLVGASVLQHFIVTLDSRSGSAYFEPYRGGPFARSSFGFGLDFDTAASVGLVWEGSPAEAAGLRVGQRVTAINGQAAETSCAGIRKAMHAISEGDTIQIEWDGGAGTLTRERTILR